MKKLLKILPVVMVVCIVLTSVFAAKGQGGTGLIGGTAEELSGALAGGEGATDITDAAKNVWQTVVTIVQILAVAAVVFAGVRYMFASADQKADIKKSMGTLAIGAVLVFGATLVIQLISGATSTVLQ